MEPLLLTIDIRHPDFLEYEGDFDKWRITYRGGDRFISRYLEKFSPRESDPSFSSRKKIAYAPTLAKAAINEIRNSLYQRMSEISRIGGPKNYQEAIIGKEAGVDLHGSSMNAFMGQDVLTELLMMGTVGVFIDKPQINDPLLTYNKDKKPYLYYYCREDILSWDGYYYNGQQIFTNVLLRSYELQKDVKTGLPLGYMPIFRHFYLDDRGKVRLDIYEEYIDETVSTALRKEKIIASYTLDLTQVPFVLMDIGQSLMEDISNYQIALLNLASSDLNYSLKSNFPFYTEQYDPMTEQSYNRRPRPPKIDPNNPFHDPKRLEEAQKGTSDLAGMSSSSEEVQVGGVSGRKYGKGLDKPSFIAPPSEPLKASMEKQQQMKEELRQIINLSLTNVAPQHASAESKKEDKSGLENGLSGIGLELEYGERRIATIWAEYENSKDIAEINYPRKYDIKSDADRQEEATSLNKLKGAAPSRTFAKEIGKQIANTMLNGKVKAETLITIMSEIDDAKFITSDAKEIQIDVQAGLVSKETASNARGYDGKTEIPIAEKEYTERMKQIAAAQQKNVGAARGVGGGGGGDPAAKVEKQGSQNSDNNPASGGDMTRGAGK